MPSWNDIQYIFYAVITIYLVVGSYEVILDKIRKLRRKNRRLGKLQNALFRSEVQRFGIIGQLIQRPLAARGFVLVTVAVTEEVLFRGYAIGVGQHLLGGALIASVISILVFTHGHRGLGRAHLGGTFIIAIIFSALFLLTNNLMSCIILHAILDGPVCLSSPQSIARAFTESLRDPAHSGASYETAQGAMRINSYVGLAPHFADAFQETYGKNSAFVTAAVDCLNADFVKAFVQAGKLPKEHHLPSWGTPARREALEQLLARLQSCGMEKPSIALLRSAVGHTEPRAFMDAAGKVLGTDVMDNWLREIQQENYAAASSLLTTHQNG